MSAKACAWPRLALLLAAGCSSSPDADAGATNVVANVKLTKAQRAHLQLYTVVPVGYRADDRSARDGRFRQ